MSSPPIRHPCHYGIDMPTSEEMIAHERTVDEIAAEVRGRLARLPVAGGRLRGGRLRARDALRRLLHRRLPARGHQAANGKHALEELPLHTGRHSRGRVTGMASRSRCSSRAPGRTCRRSSTRSTAATASRWTRSSATAPTPGRSSGPRGRRRDRRVRGGRLRRPRRARPRDGRLAEERGVHLVVLAGFMQLLDAGFLAEFPQARDQRPSGAAASLSRAPPDRGPDRLRRQSRRSDGPLRGRRRRHRADHLAGGGNASLHSGREGGPDGSCTAPSTSSCPARSG